MIADRIAPVVIGLALALGLAILAAHPAVKKWEQRLGVTVLISSGIPFLALGALFHWNEIGILTDPVLADLRPAFNFGLGWVGFVVGMHFDIHRLDKLPGSIGAVMVVQSLLPMLTTALLCTPMLYFLELPPEDKLPQSVLIFMACAAASAPVSIKALSRRYGGKAARIIDEITNLDEIAALAILGLVTILFRPANLSTSWVLPPSAWFLMSMGMGALLGVMTYILIRGATNEAEEIALLIGAVALAAGIADYLRLSIPVICALAGALLANLPMRDQEGLKKDLLDVERPIYLIFLLVVGASWRVDEWQGWILAPVFVLARVSGKVLGAIWGKRIGPKSLPPARSLALALTPQSPIAIVVIVSASTLYLGEEFSQGGALPDFVRWSINAVIIGSVLTEIVSRLLQRFDPVPLPALSPKLSETGDEDLSPEAAPQEPPQTKDTPSVKEAASSSAQNPPAPAQATESLKAEVSS